MTPLPTPGKIYTTLATSFTWAVGVPYLAAMTIARALLWAYAVAADQVQPGLASVFKIFTLGFLNDLATLTFVAATFAVLSLLFPRAVWRSRVGLPLAAVLYVAFLCLMIFSTVAELAFWDEFANRFNFIAVDYLVYTDEVLNNIMQSYPVAWLLAGVAALAAFVTWLQWNFVKQCVATARSYKPRLLEAALLVLLSIGVYFGIDANSIKINNDHYSTELGKNGWYGLFSAFQRNELPYDKFYLTLTHDEAFGNLHNLLAIPGEKRLHPQDIYSVARSVKPATASSKPNVVLITVESLSAEFVAKYGNTTGLTPNINKLMGQSLVFNKYYATGNRTVRGLEAEAMGIPPTPGSSIIRQNNNEGLYTIGSVLKAHGYDNKFIYGGYGYFDNMNYFFTHNGFGSVDQSDMSSKEITFSNAWGVADDNLLDRTLVEADKSYMAQKPFFSLVMTTTNHRPYTFPEGRIDLPQGHREGAVKYTDWAIGDFLEKAKSKPWFNNTIFIITGDHCASSAGHTELPVEKYHVPLVVYAPKLVKPREVNALVSQMDLPPTIMGFLNLPYTSRFFGTDMLKLKKERALFATYQAMGYYTPGNLVVLMPNNKVEAFTVAADGTQTSAKPDQKLVNEAISFYQTAYELFTSGKMKE